MELAIVFFLLGPLVLAVVSFILVLVTRSNLGRLRNEVDRLRQRVQVLERGAPAPDAARPAPAPTPEAATPPPPPPVSEPARPAAAAATPPPPPPPRPRRQTDLEKVIGGQWLTWLGIIAIFLGTAFFLAFDLGASPLAGLPQVLIAAAVAVAFLLVGRWVIDTVHRFLGLGLLGGGIALFYLVAFGLFGFHRLVPIEVVFPALLAVAFVGALVALAQDSRTIAGLTLVGALITPLVLAGDRDAGTVLWPYLIAVDLGAVLVGRRRGWAILPLGSFVGTTLLVARWWQPNFTPSWRGTVIGVGGVLWLLYGLVPWLGRSRPGFWGLARTALVAANGAWYAALVYAALGPGLDGVRGPALFLIAAVYVAASLFGARGRREDPALIANFYTGAALAIIAVPVQFEDFTVSLAWGLVGLLLLVMGWRLNDPHHRVAALAGLFFAAVRMVAAGLDGLGHGSLGYRPLWNLDFLPDLGVVAALLAAVWILRRSGPPAFGLEAWGRRVLGPVAALAGWWAVSLEGIRYMAASKGTVLPIVTVALIWSLYAALLQALGRRTGRAWLRGLALGVLALAGAATILIQVVNTGSRAQGWYPLWNAGFVAGVVGVVVLAWIARCARHADDASPDWEWRLGTPLLIVTLAAALLTASLEILAVFHARHGGNILADAAALLTLSLFWTLYGGGLVWGGFATRERAVRLAGMALLGLVIVKIFAVDIRALSAGYRIVSFVGVGVLLLVISLLYQREKRLGADG